MTQSKRRTSSPGAARRLTLKTLGGSALAGGLLNQLPGSWQRPIVHSAVLPTHAQSSAALNEIRFMIRDTGGNPRTLSINYTVLRQAEGVIYAVIFPSGTALEVSDASVDRSADLMLGLFPPAFAQFDLEATTTPGPDLFLTEDLLLDFSNERTLVARGMLKLGYGPDRCDDFLVRVTLNGARTEIARMDGDGRRDCGTEYTIEPVPNPSGSPGGFNAPVPVTGVPVALTTPAPVVVVRQISLMVTDTTSTQMATMSFDYEVQLGGSESRRIDYIRFQATAVQMVMHQPASKVLAALFPAAQAQAGDLTLDQVVELDFTDNVLTKTAMLPLRYDDTDCEGTFDVTVTLYPQRAGIESISGDSNITECGSVNVMIEPDSGFGTFAPPPPEPEVPAAQTTAAGTTLAAGATAAPTTTAEPTTAAPTVPPTTLPLTLIGFRDSDLAVMEGDSVSVFITVTGQSAVTFNMIRVSSSDATGADLVKPSGTRPGVSTIDTDGDKYDLIGITVATGAGSISVPLTILDDNQNEGDETLTFELQSPSGADPGHMVDIDLNNRRINISISDPPTPAPTTTAEAMTTAAPTGTRTITNPITSGERWFEWTWSEGTKSVTGQFRIRSTGSAPMGSITAGDTITGTNVYYHMITVREGTQTADRNLIGGGSSRQDFSFTLPALNAMMPSAFAAPGATSFNELRLYRGSYPSSYIGLAYDGRNSTTTPWKASGFGSTENNIPPVVVELVN